MLNNKIQSPVCCSYSPHLLNGMIQQEAVGKGLWVDIPLGAKVHLDEQVPAGHSIQHTLICMSRHL